MLLCRFPLCVNSGVVFRILELLSIPANGARGFSDADFIDEILPIKAGESIFRQISNWKDGQFDLAVLFTNSFQTALIAKLANIKRRFGYGNEGRSILLTNSIAKPSWKNEKHEIYYYLNLVEEIEKNFRGDVSQFEPQFDLHVAEKRISQAQKILLENGADLTKPLIAFCPGSTNSRAKRWQTKGYAELSNRIQGELGEILF